MLSLAASPKARSYRPMAALRDIEASDRRRKGLALKALRRRLGVTQEAAAQEYGKTTQAWQLYEQGKRHFSDPKLDKLLASINATREEFEFELSKIPEIEADLPSARSGVMGIGEPTAAFSLPVGGVAHGGALRPNVYDDQQGEVIDFARFFSAGTRVLRLGGMSMYPYAEPGGFVTYNPRHPARRGQGAVIEMLDGGFAVKRFERYEGDMLIVTELFPEEQELKIPLDTVAGVYAIGLRGE
ncbi:XRE family transcriptional regulator [Brevundimonas vesicularis]|uniref:XRE family transcriptional regulator n=1 Tax=Brevundimonas vesicularis TaxID=41276 RepID=A0A1Z3U624_BREVE|nr:XRE family transcriptional regulator [Brevundimonas vesicularis]ASE38394.1 XRE family transcriptional regulator [Brevundimonas vesicularis]